MMRKISTIATVALTLGILFCSSSNNGTSDPTKTTEEFNNPTGDLTSANALSVANGGINGIGVAIFNDPEAIFDGFSIESDCTTVSGDDTTTEWDCAFNNVTGCTGDGTTTTTDDDGKDFIASSYDGFSVDCSGADPDDNFSVSCDGDVNVSRDDNLIYCSNLDCTFNDGNKKFNGCRNSDGYVLVRLDGDSFVVRQISVNGPCTEATFTVRDKDSTETIICDVAESENGCNSSSDVTEVENCVVQ